MKPIIISAPFGNWLGYEGATSTLGTFTMNYRGGTMYRIWRCLRTLRYQRHMGGWVNKLALPNPGIRSLSLDKSYDDKIISIHGFGQNDWVSLARVLVNDLQGVRAVELNISCVNTGESYSNIIADIAMATYGLLDFNKIVIAKLPPIRWMEAAIPLYDLGVRWFHCCNTMATPKGGLSGKTLKPYALWATQEIKAKWSDVKVIGGGGVTEEKDYHDFLKAGADHVAIGSVLLNPLNHRRIKRLIESVNSGISK